MPDLSLEPFQDIIHLLPYAAFDTETLKNNLKNIKLPVQSTDRKDVVKVTVTKAETEQIKSQRRHSLEDILDDLLDS